ncbi:hypothetical protein FA95DRAFT_1682308 [Auriscalpium vulgare]|uniref:Uncharacterized protein n=1 Tax=Auriscalpium vulgare TaxID=40419 RepID=A0ACB8RG05_9AGAM|nr:hypothetical protein FA95DRAFT_1682308 [Auriscalpium vulgare]
MTSHMDIQTLHILKQRTPQLFPTRTRPRPRTTVRSPERISPLVPTMDDVADLPSMHTQSKSLLDSLVVDDYKEAFKAELVEILQLLESSKETLADLEQRAARARRRERAAIETMYRRQREAREREEAALADARHWRQKYEALSNEVRLCSDFADLSC